MIVEKGNLQTIISPVVLFKSLNSTSLRNTYYNGFVKLKNAVWNKKSEKGFEARIKELLNYDTTELRQLVYNHGEEGKHCDYPRYNKLKENCTFKSLREHIERCGYFPRNITWKGDVPATTGFCKLHEVVDRLPLLQYFHRYINDIVATGDSQGKKYSRAFIDNINQFGIKCELLKEEKKGYKISADYYHRTYISLKEIRALLSPRRFCHSCNSFQQKCTVPPVIGYNESKVFIFEYISLVMNNNISLLNKNYCRLNPGLEICEHDKQLDFIFNYYLRGRTPELILLSTTFAHTFAPVEEMLNDLVSLQRMIQSTFANKSHTIWLPSTAPNGKKRVSIPEVGWDNKIKIEVLNHWLAEMLRTYFVHGEDKNRIDGFLDVWTMGADRVDKWKLDFIHFKTPFYRTVIDVLFKLLITLDED